MVGKTLLLLLLLSLTGGCASVHSGTFAMPIDKDGRVAPSSQNLSGLRISSRQVTTLSSRHFGALEITFENLSDDWVRIVGASLDFGSTARNTAVFIPAGDDLARWQEGTQRRNAIRDTNATTGLEFLFLGALAVGSAAGSRSPVAGAAALAGAGAAVALGARGIGERVEAAQTVALYPASHLLAVPFGVPPGLSIKRWIVLNARPSVGSGCISWADLAYQTEDRRQERVRLQFRDYSSEWQRPICSSGLEPRPPHRP